MPYKTGLRAPDGFGEPVAHIHPGRIRLVAAHLLRYAVENHVEHRHDGARAFVHERLRIAVDRLAFREVPFRVRRGEQLIELRMLPMRFIGGRLRRVEQLEDVSGLIE